MGYCGVVPGYGAQLDHPGALFRGVAVCLAESTLQQLMEARLFRFLTVPGADVSSGGIREQGIRGCGADIHFILSWRACPTVFSLFSSREEKGVS